MQIIPTVGRVMWFYPSTRTGQNNFTPPHAGEPCAAVVVAVNADNMVNLTVFDAGGFPHPRQNVPVAQEGDPVPVDGYYVTWMPYQIGQAKKEENEPAPPVDNAHVSPGCEQFTDEQIEQSIQAKGKTAPRVTPAALQAVIVSEHYFTAADGVAGASSLMEDPEGPLTLLTFCVLVLRNGFTVTGESACVSEENFDSQIGRDVARKNALEKIWPLEGYLLKQKLHDAT